MTLQAQAGPLHPNLSVDSDTLRQGAGHLCVERWQLLADSAGS